MMERWADLTGDDIAARAGDAVVLLPLAAIEAHGPHLPVGTDARIADGLLDATAALVDASIDVLRLPILWLGVSPEHAGHGGTLSQPASSWIETVLTVLGGLAAQGVRKVVLFATHGGNIAPSRTAAMEARHRTGMLVVAVHWQEFGWPVALEQASSSGLPSSRDARRDVHGGWVETSIMQAIDATAVAKTPPGPAHRSPPAKALFPE
ncbi:MAG: creatininase family protein, partial [Pseudomonadota bacterium]